MGFFFGGGGVSNGSYKDHTGLASCFLFAAFLCYGNRIMG